MRPSNETEALFAILRELVAPEAARAIEASVLHGDESSLCRINALDFAVKNGLDEETTIGGLLHAARLGVFELNWNVLCPGCGGVIESGASLKVLTRRQYTCALCAAGYEPTLDEVVEVTFTVAPSVRRIGAHDPNTLPMIEYYRQIFWGSGFDLPDRETLARILDEVTLDSIELPPGERATVSLQAPEGFLIVHDPVVHLAQFIEVQGEPTRERQTLTAILNTEHAPADRATIRPGPLRIFFENRAKVRTLPSVWLANDALHDLMGKRRPFLTAKRLLTNQTFRELYRADTLNVDQRFKITSLTFLFTDLKGSTELYDRVGDLVAYDLVSAHFRALQAIVASEAGAVVKTIGDAVMATFPTPDRAIAAALRMRTAMRELGSDFILKIGIHEGPCLAVMLNERQDYFGQTVNIAARVQGLANSSSIFATKQVVGHGASERLLVKQGILPLQRESRLRGIAAKIDVFEIQ